MTPDPAPTVHLIDDDDSLRAALKRLLSAVGLRVHSYRSATEFLLQRDPVIRGCLVVDVRMPGGPGGLELQEALIRQGIGLPLIFITGHGDIPMSVRAIKAGAFDFLTKPVKGDDLLPKIRAALEIEEQEWLAAQQRRDLRQRFERLTPTEKEVFYHVIAGIPNKGIAYELGCSERTVKAHRAQVMSKMEANSLAELIQISGEIPKNSRSGE
ncbi:MAG: response regulator transcription factor [Luteolibacter sp.]